MENENQSVSGINRPRGLRLIEFIEVMYYIPRKENVGTIYVWVTKFGDSIINRSRKWLLKF